MEEDSWGDWSSDLVDSLDEEFLRDILQQPQDSTAPVAAPVLAATTVGSLFLDLDQTSLGGSSVNLNLQVSSSNSSIISQHTRKKPDSSPTTYVLSFHNYTTASTPTINDPCCAWEEFLLRSQLGSHGTHSSPLSSSRANLGTKKNRSASETLNHIMTERKRRQELTKKFIALSATIPGLKKMDKSHVLGEAIKYVKQLQNRVKELEEGIKKSDDESVIAITRCHLFSDDEGTTFCETNSNGCYRSNEALPSVEASVSGKEVLIKIHCGKQKGILLKTLSHFESLHLSIASSNVLPFGNTLDITIIAKIGDKYSMKVKDLAKTLRQAMLKSCDVQE